MEYFLLYAIGLSLISLLCMILAKSPVEAPPHADSDTGLNLLNASMPLPHIPELDTPIIPPTQGFLSREWPSIHQLIEDETPRAVSDSVNPFAEN